MRRTWLAELLELAEVAETPLDVVVEDAPQPAATTTRARASRARRARRSVIRFSLGRVCDWHGRRAGSPRGQAVRRRRRGRAAPTSRQGGTPGPERSWLRARGPAAGRRA